jgi:hypothetical protein
VADGGNGGDVGHSRPPHDHDGFLEQPSSVKLGDGVLAPTVFGDENVDAVLTHECEFAVKGVGAAGEKELHPLRMGRLGRINTPNEKPEG